MTMLSAHTKKLDYAMRTSPAVLQIKTTVIRFPFTRRGARASVRSPIQRWMLTQSGNDCDSCDNTNTKETHQGRGVNVLCDSVFSDRSLPGHFPGPKKYTELLWKVEEIPEANTVIVSLSPRIKHIHPVCRGLHAWSMQRVF
ncbi:hypothetical protein EDD85DRAFT_794101 [Armillaria nabsnona]|nr:hypothetical protein EDD85DRAFT_794101 [Armillaria nabsnona]